MFTPLDSILEMMRSTLRRHGKCRPLAVAHDFLNRRLWVRAVGDEHRQTADLWLCQTERTRENKAEAHTEKQHQAASNGEFTQEHTFRFRFVTADLLKSYSLSTLTHRRTKQSEPHLVDEPTPRHQSRIRRRIHRYRHRI